MSYNYWRDTYQPMTREHYASGGHYCQLALCDPLHLSVGSGYHVVRELTLAQALTCGYFPILIVYPCQKEGIRV